MQMKEMTTSWEQKLEAARKEWESEHKVQNNKDEMLNFSHPYLQVWSLLIQSTYELWRSEKFQKGEGA